MYPIFLVLHTGLAPHPGCFALYPEFVLFLCFVLYPEAVLRSAVLLCTPGLFCTPRLLFCNFRMCSVPWAGSAPRVFSPRRFSFLLLDLFFAPGLFFCSRFCCLSLLFRFVLHPCFSYAPRFFSSPFLFFTHVSILHRGFYFECPWLPFPSCLPFTVTGPHCAGPAGCTSKCRPGSPLLPAPKQRHVSP